MKTLKIAQNVILCVAITFLAVHFFSEHTIEADHWVLNWLQVGWMGSFCLWVLLILINSRARNKAIAKGAAMAKDWKIVEIAIMNQDGTKTVINGFPFDIEEMGVYLAQGTDEVGPDGTIRKIWHQKAIIWGTRHAVRIIWRPKPTPAAAA